MAVSAVSANTSAAVAKASKGLADNFDTFLTLLTTQLKNQDPLAPMDSAQFTNQLVQFSSVEQSIQTNKNLESLLALTGANTTTASLGYLGREVTVNTDRGNLRDGSATWNYQVAPSASSSVITIRDSSGKITGTREGEFGAGMHKFTWNGKDANGIDQPDGIYSLSVSALDNAKNAVSVQVFSTGIVEAVEAPNGNPMLTVGGVKARPDQILSVAIPRSTPSEK